MRRKEPTLTPILFGKASDKTRRRLGFWVMQHWRLRRGPSRTALCSTRRKQVQNGAVGDAEQSDRADAGGEAGNGKPAAAAEIELPRPLAI